MNAAHARFLPLDGIRATAFGAVFLHHALQVPLLWSGVDMFFVLSGYLITGILIRTRDREGYFRRFYRNRSYRIFPLYYLVIALALLAFGAPMLQELPWALTYTMNVHRGLYSQDSPLTPLWSLAIEEQFYLLWPLALWFCPKRHRVTLIACLLVAAPMLRALTYIWLGSTAAGTLLFCRMDGLLLGALIAVVGTARRSHGDQWLRRKALWLVGPLGLIFAGVAYIAPQDSLVFSVVAYEASAWFFSAVLVIVLTGGVWKLNSLLAWAPMAYIGRISYGLYVFHMPALFIARDHLDNPAIIALLAGMGTLAAATASWRFFEQPLLEFRDRRHRQAIPEETAAVSEETLQPSGDRFVG